MIPIYVAGGIRGDHAFLVPKSALHDVNLEAIDIYNYIDKKKLRESYLAHIPQLGI